jgi:hypothetical protein
MPRLAKGGKWVYGWVVVRPRGHVCRFRKRAEPKREKAGLGLQSSLTAESMLLSDTRCI